MTVQELTTALTSGPLQSLLLLTCPASFPVALRPYLRLYAFFLALFFRKHTTSSNYASSSLPRIARVAASVDCCCFRL